MTASGDEPRRTQGVDTAYQCTFRQDDVRSQRGRVDEIAAVYGL